MKHNHKNTTNGTIINFTRPTGTVKTEVGIYSFSEYLVCGKIYRNAKVKVETDNNNRLVKIYGEDVQCCDTSSAIKDKKENKKLKKKRKKEN